ncbi:galactose-binding domain-like protein [Suillus subalutaceus]|uniref:galactose-binding domain-like protein n=1 Tax=Suillus subalutaceus TaxID=48586 RepID=UPI001B86C886|nr:galactose-binding domain-like protein [Suillus subalutaceus]KAG1868273.1 galactose-binding domain-like protein [Suillus subalutaceus]
MDNSYVSLISTNPQHVKVSSTLEKSTGKKHLTDSNPETCWTSREGPGQYIHLTFEKPAIPKRITIIFQGGFVGTKCRIEVSESSDRPEWQTWTHIHPEDANRRQTFDLIIHRDGFPGEGIQSMKLVFEESSDFYGRITIYELKIEGLLL